MGGQLKNGVCRGSKCHARDRRMETDRVKPFRFPSPTLSSQPPDHERRGRAWRTSRTCVRSISDMLGEPRAQTAGSLVDSFEATDGR